MGDLSREPQLCGYQQTRRLQFEVVRVRDEPDPGVPHNVLAGVLEPLGVHEVPDGQPKHRAVGKQLVEVRLRETAGLRGLVLGVHDDSGRAAFQPHEVRANGHGLRLVQVGAMLQRRPPAVRLHRLPQSDRHEVLEDRRHVEQVARDQQLADPLLERRRSSSIGSAGLVSCALLSL